MMSKCLEKVEKSGLYEKNIEFIKNHNPKLYEEIIKKESRYHIDVKYVEEYGNYILRRGESECFWFSVYDRENEMRAMFKRVSENLDCLVLFGAGDGYVPNYVIKKFHKLKKLIIIEPSLELFKIFLQNFDLPNLIYNFQETIIILNQSVDVADFLINKNIAGFSNIDIICSISYYSIFNDYYLEIVKRFREAIRRNITNANFSHTAWSMLLINNFRNLKYREHTIDELSNFIKNKPVIIVSAGPSLDKNKYLLEEAKKGAVVIAVGSAIRILSVNGIKPHFNAAYDGLPAEKLIFDYNIDTGIPLLCGNKLYYEILDNYAGKKFFINSNEDNLIAYIYEMLSKVITNIPCSPSIAVFITNLMCSLGCSKIIFVGQDLCYTGDKLYASGARSEERNIDFNQEKFKKAKDIYGNDVYVDLSFMTYKAAFETIIRMYKEKVKFINATEGGVNIEGTVIKTLNDVISEELQFTDIDSELSKYLESEHCEFSAFEIENVLAMIKKEAKEVLELNRERLEMLVNVQKYIDIGYKENRILKELRAVENFEEKLMNIGYYKKVVAKDLNEVLKSIRAFYNSDNYINFTKVLLGISIEIEKHALFTLQLIDEYNESKNVFPTAIGVE